MSSNKNLMNMHTKHIVLQITRLPYHNDSPHHSACLPNAPNCILPSPAPSPAACFSPFSSPFFSSHCSPASQWGWQTSWGTPRPELWLLSHHASSLADSCASGQCNHRCLSSICNGSSSWPPLQLPLPPPQGCSKLPVWSASSIFFPSCSSPPGAV